MELHQEEESLDGTGKRRNRLVAEAVVYLSHIIHLCYKKKAMTLGKATELCGMFGTLFSCCIYIHTLEKPLRRLFA